MTGRRSQVLGLALLAAMGVWGLPLRAQIAPGKMSQAHAHLEGLGNCTRCHSAKKQIDPARCLDCHALIKARIDAGRGLHAQPDHRRCQDCHVEHHGREFSLIRWPGGEIGRFDHRLTGHTLEGRHAALDCRDCHQAAHIADPDPLLQAGKALDRTYLGLSGECLGCHADSHRGQLGTSCTDCHDQEGWKPAPAFSHDRSAFPLKGRHRQADCDSCHATVHDGQGAYVQYRGVAHAQCTACHVDVHQGRLGNQCNRCHSPNSWADIPQGRFSHDMTPFPLKGRHQDLACTACHKQGRSSPVARYGACADCHADVHAGQFADRPGGGACEGCHTEAGFSPSTYTLARHQQSRFPLDGAHPAVPCIDCHTKPEEGGVRRFRFAPLSCQSCHVSPHGAEIDDYLRRTSPLTGKSGCAFCHETGTWSAVRFDHAQTRFVLDGRHLEAGCDDCHPGKADGKRPLTVADGRCQACHEDVHRGQLADPGTPGTTSCQRCHTATDWLAEKFNHDTDSAFPLTGRHRTLACDACHHPVEEGGVRFIRYKPLGKRCDDCHVDRSQTK